MKTVIKEISESQFNDSNTVLLFKDETSNRKFGLLDEGVRFKLAWHSDSISPTITEIKPQLLGIGIDQNFAIVDVANPTPLLKLTLDYPYCTTEIFGGHIFVTSQLEIIKIDMNTWSVIQRYDLPEYYESMRPKGNGYEVQCIEDVTLDII